MNFDFYKPFKNKEGVWVPGITPHPMNWHDIRKEIAKDKQYNLCNAIRQPMNDDEKAGKDTFKKQLFACCFTGNCAEGRKRAQANMIPTGLVFIDIDHVGGRMEAINAWETIRRETVDPKTHGIYLVYVTASFGLRIILKASGCYESLEEELKWWNDTLRLDRFGDVDFDCHDYSRLSFLTTPEDILYEDWILLDGDPIPHEDIRLVNGLSDLEGTGKRKSSKSNDTPEPFTEDEIKEYEEYDYHGHQLKEIIERWTQKRGRPGKGEVHNYYNEMVKHFRNICSNNKRCLLYLLPRFGHTEEECWSQIKSICKVNTLSKLEPEFYWFLVDNGYLIRSGDENKALAEYMLSEDDKADDEKIPWLPPVFREFVKIAPKDFKPPMINALLPIMGTLTSYLQAPYYFDGKMHTTTFFSIVYAGPSSNKSFAGQVKDILFEQLKIRDDIQKARERIYLAKYNETAKTEKSPEDPHTTPRIIPCKNSETEFLETMEDCKGYHMFTYAAEMDTWAKGVKAAGGNKDDMVRIAWDNDTYGQSFKNKETFKGEVALYWNVLITGSLDQILAYYKNVTNGLVTRCSFTEIENQEFAPAPIWNWKLPKKDRQVIEKFMSRCDANSYEEPCELLPSKEEMDSISPENFDREVNWKFHFKKRQTVNMEWLRPTILAFLERHRVKAAIDFDHARDTFRRRVAVRGFRLGIMCYALWDKPRLKDLEKCIPFIDWWMEKDIAGSLKLWGAKYNEATSVGPTLPQKSLYEQLPKQFSRNEVLAQCQRLGIKSKIADIIYRWKQLGYIKKTAAQEWEKIKNEKLKN